MTKEVRDVLKQLEQRGWEVVPGKHKHFKVRHPDHGTYSLSRSPSDRRWRRNLLHDIERLEQERP